MKTSKFKTVCEISGSLWYKFIMSHYRANFDGVLFPKHWKVFAFVISFSLTGAKTLESFGLLSSWCGMLETDKGKIKEILSDSVVYIRKVILEIKCIYLFFEGESN